MERRMVFITCVVILFLICGSSAIISQNDLAFWTLLKEYHEMDLPAQAVAAGGANDSGGGGGGGVAPPVAVPVARAGRADDAEDDAKGAGPVAQPAADDVALRLLVQLTSEPVRLRVRCERGCSRVHRPCDLYLAPGSPLRMVCYAMLPECMHYGHTTINCGVYFTKRWPEVIQGVCTLDYHTSDSICASFARAGGQGGSGAEAEKPFRLMLEALGVRLWPANATASASAGLADAPPPAAPDAERATWLLAAAVLLALLLAGCLVRRFDLAHWTPCAAATWLNRYEVVEATRHVVGRSPLSVVANVPFDSSDPGHFFSIRTRDTYAEAPTTFRNYKLFMVFIDGINNRRFSLPVPSSCLYFEADNLRMADVPQNRSCASAPPFNHLNSPVLPTGISENNGVLLPSQPIPLTFREHSLPTARNALPFYQETSHLQDSPHGCASTHNAISSFTESPIQEISSQLRKESKVVISHMSASTENSLAVVSLSHSTASVSETTCFPSHDALQLATTKNDSLKVSLSSHFTSKSKPTAMTSQEVETTLLTSPCPPTAPQQTPKPSPAPTNAVHPQQLHSSVLPQTVSLAYPTAWVCPMVVPHPMTSYPGSPACPPNSSELEITNSEVTVPSLSDGFVQPSSFTLTTDYPSAITYPNTQGYFSNGPCSETVVLPAMQTYTVTEAYSPGCLPTTVYSTVAFTYPLPVYSQAAINPHNGIHYQYPEGIVGSENQVPTSTIYSNSACSENAGYIPDFRGRTEGPLSICALQPPSSNSEVVQITSECPENRSYPESFVRQPYVYPTPCNTAGLPTYTANPAVCYPTASTYSVMSDSQAGPSAEDYTQNSLGPSASTNPQTFNNQQPINNRPGMVFYSPHLRTCVNQQPSSNQRILHHPRRSAPPRPTNQHSFGIQRCMDQQHSPSNYRPLNYHRTAINMRPSSNQRSTQRAPTYQQTFYRPAPMHSTPHSHQTAATNQPAIPFRATTNYGATYHPVAPLNTGGACHTTARYHPAAVYQGLSGSQPEPTNPPAHRFSPVFVCQDANSHQQPGVAYTNDGGYQPETPFPLDPVSQSAATYEAIEAYNSEALQQPPPAYQTSVLPPPPNYQQSDIFQPPTMYQQTHLYQIPAFQQGSANPSAPVYQVTPAHQAIPGQLHGIPNELACGFTPPLNCQGAPYPTYVPTITSCNQNCNQMIAVDDTASLRPEATEHPSSFVPQPIMGYCTNSAYLEAGSYHDTSGDSQRVHTEDQQNGCYSENARDCSIPIGAPDICVNQNNCGQPFSADPRAMQMCQIRSDYPVISSLPLRTPYPTSAENMEAASMTTPGHSTAYITNAGWENNSAHGGTMIGQPMPYSQQPWIGPTVSAPQQIYEVIDEGAYRNEEETSRGSDIQEATPSYHSNHPCYECNTHLQTHAYNASDENCQFYQQTPEQSTGSGDGQNDPIPQRNLIMGADGCVYQGQPIFRNERSQGLPTRRELGDGDSHRIHCCDRAQFQVKDDPCNPLKCEVRTDNRFLGAHTDNNCYDSENANTVRQFCCECSRGCCRNPGRRYMNGLINQFQPGGSCVIRDASNDISSNFSQLSLNDATHRAS